MSKKVRSTELVTCDMCDYIFDATAEDIERKKKEQETKNPNSKFLPDVHVVKMTDNGYYYMILCDSCYNKSTYEVCLGDGKIEAFYKTS